MRSQPVSCAWPLRSAPLRGLEIGDQPARLGEEGLALLGQGQRPGRAAEQLGAQMRLQRRDLLADGALGRGVFARDRRERAGLDDAHEDFHGGETVQGSFLPGIYPRRSCQLSTRKGRARFAAVLTAPRAKPGADR